MISGVHALLHTPDPEGLRAFFRDVLGFGSVDAGDGWLIFALPPAELGIHPAEPGGGVRAELHLMCDDLAGAVKRLEAKGVRLARPVTDQGRGLVTAVALPGGGELGLYEARHPTAFDLPRKIDGGAEPRD